MHCYQEKIFHQLVIKLQLIPALVTLVTYTL